MLHTLHYRLHHSAWYLQPAYFQSLKAELGQKMPDIRQQNDIEEFCAFFFNQRAPLLIDSNGIAILSISGVLANDLARIDRLLGFTDYADIQAEAESVIEQGAKALLIDVDSPGGQSQGALETAQLIASLELPKASYTAGLDTSAAYFITSSVDRKFVSPSAFSGSIGTILPWIDESKFWDALGFSWEPITGQGESFKGTGAGPALSDFDRAHLQEQVNELSVAFRDHVSNYRELDYSQLQGGAYFGSRAISLNLADQIGTFDDAYQWLFSLVS